VKIYEFQPRFAHQKILAIDNWTTIGSSNMNHRSFLHDLEVDVVITHLQNQKLLREKLCGSNSSPIKSRGRIYKSKPGGLG